MKLPKIQPAEVGTGGASLGAPSFSKKSKVGKVPRAVSIADLMTRSNPRPKSQFKPPL